LLGSTSRAEPLRSHGRAFSPEAGVPETAAFVVADEHRRLMYRSTESSRRVAARQVSIVPNAAAKLTRSAVWGGDSAAQWLNVGSLRQAESEEPHSHLA
jgi:hypothetical protein